MLRTDASGRGDPAGWVETKPGPADSVTVMLSDIASASGETPPGSGTVTEPPGGTIAVSRVSSSLAGAIGTNRPDEATSADSNQPIVSITMSPLVAW